MGEQQLINKKGVCVLLAADHLFQAVLVREGPEVGLDDPAAAEAQHEVKRGLLLDVVVGQGAVILQLLPCKDEALLVRRQRRSIAKANVGYDSLAFFL